MKRFAFILVAFGCHSNPTSHEPHSIGGPADCEPACAKLRQFGCPEATPTKVGESCEHLCVRLVDADMLGAGPDCIAAAKSVEALHDCGVDCRTRSP